MADEVWRSLVQALDDPESFKHASTALESLLNNAGKSRNAAAVTVAGMVLDLKTAAAKSSALGILARYAPNSPESLELAISMSHDEDKDIRYPATAFLTGVPENPKAQARIFKLLEDPNQDIRNLAIQSVGKMNLPGGPAAAASVLYVIPDDGQREEAIRLLDELERAVKTLQDLGLDDGQNQIVDELILPNVAELKRQFGAESPGVDEVIEERKLSLVALGRVFGSVKALALVIPVVAVGDEAIRNVQGAAKAIEPFLDSIKGLL